MLGRYKITRGRSADYEAIPRQQREDTRKHTAHPLRPTHEMVERLLEDPENNWPAFRDAYVAELEHRYEADTTPFDALAERARAGDVYLGCNCPTRKQPDVQRCHTVLAMQFMQQRYPDLVIDWPD
jgi:uncharacterized protein YeaO (DUF488 family)